MLRLGTVTTPHGLSAGSPERYWACIRYLSACTDEGDLRIRQPFLELDPHQRGILSDDFGVALTTTWLAERLGGIREIVDGRKFALNYGFRKHGKRKKKLAKMGPNKCPDYVLRDNTGLFHVLECKGTQSAAYLKSAMTQGRRQKAGIDFGKTVLGEKLVIGLRLRGEGEKKRSALIVSDPSPEPVVKVTAKKADKAQRIMDRLGVARALNLSGFGEVASELSFAAGQVADEQTRPYFLKSELKRLSYDRKDRHKRVIDDITRALKGPAASTDDVIQQMAFSTPGLRLDGSTEVSRVVVTRGVSRQLLERLRGARPDSFQGIAEDVMLSKSHRITVDKAQRFARIDYAGIAFAEVLFS